MINFTVIRINFYKYSLKLGTIQKLIVLNDIVKLYKVNVRKYFKFKELKK